MPADFLSPTGATYLRPDCVCYQSGVFLAPLPKTSAAGRDVTGRRRRRMFSTTVTPPADYTLSATMLSSMYSSLPYVALARNQQSNEWSQSASSSRTFSSGKGGNTNHHRRHHPKRHRPTIRRRLRGEGSQVPATGQCLPVLSWVTRVLDASQRRNTPCIQHHHARMELRQETVPLARHTRVNRYH